MKIQIKTLALIFFLSSGFYIPLLADSTRSWEAANKYDASKDQITKILKKLDQELYPENESQGFKFRLNTGFWSPFNYDLFLGTLSQDNPLTIIRLEGDSGDVMTISRVLEQEKAFKTGVHTYLSSLKGIKPVKLTEKNHYISQSLNILAPWLSVIHSAWDSPRLTMGQAIFRFTSYFLFDGLMVWAGGTNFGQSEYDAVKNRDSIIAALLIPRILGAWQHANLVRGHNRLARLGYTFYLE